METAKELIMKRIIGEVILSDSPGEIMRRWREVFGITQLEVAEKLEISPSVISDYEGGRRKSPGAFFIKRFVSSLIDIDHARGDKVLSQFTFLTKAHSDAILDLYEFVSPLPISAVAKVVDGEFVACENLANKSILGYTVVDSIKAILAMSGADFFQLLGSTTERAIIFTKSTGGRSPMVAVRVTPLKPAAIILHGITRLDTIAIELAKSERIPLIVSRKDSVESLIRSLHTLRT